MNAPLRKGREASAFAACFLLLGLLPPLAGQTQDQPKRLNPFVGDPEALKEGRRLWFQLGCSGCHGVLGGGGMGAPVLDDTWRFGSDDGTIYKLIRGQIPEQTMPPFATISDEQAWKVLGYVRTLYRGEAALINWAVAGSLDATETTAAPQLTPAPTPPTRPADAKSPIASHVSHTRLPIVDKAKAMYDAQCSLCHGSAGAGDGPLALKLKVEPSDWTADGGGLAGMGDQQIFDAIAKGGVAVGKSIAMPDFPKLSESEVRSLVAHVKGLMGNLEAVTPEQHASAPKPRPLEAEPLRWGSALDWGVVLTIGVSVLILVCIVASLVLYRGRQPEGNALWLHLLSLGVFPLALLAVGNFSVLEYAKEERFCGTCHLAMKPYIDDMHSGESRSLAALHFRDRFARGTECYSCHANYGVHGTFEAKMKGLEDVYKYETRTYHLPLKMRAPYENALCLKCHAEAKRFTEAFEGVHVRLSEQLRTGVIRCVGCHKLAHDIPRGEQAARLGEAY